MDQKFTTDSARQSIAASMADVDAIWEFLNADEKDGMTITLNANLAEWLHNHLEDITSTNYCLNDQQMVMATDILFHLKERMHI